MNTPNLSAAVWRKSSYSNGGDANCIEVADDYPGIIPVRDSKDPNGPALVFSADGWSSFIFAVQHGEFPAT
ncbi:DUF397 domain-containing protein [Streptomyces antimycoticus]|uniref:DUF397 domain-containing protein n=1 Tax=Streptomyces TaxID=1883 RepID=UPI000F79FC43|nr:DUF397 domain-containing protein [Streptomyces sp. WAC05858]RSS45616.1 DUF397 domain-containing protein [Streptomyces sp. WAC05858]